MSNDFYFWAKNEHLLNIKRTQYESNLNMFVIFEEFQRINGLLKASHKRKINSVIESKISSA